MALTTKEWFFARKHQICKAPTRPDRLDWLICGHLRCREDWTVFCLVGFNGLFGVQSAGLTSLLKFQKCDSLCSTAGEWASNVKTGIVCLINTFVSGPCEAIYLFIYNVFSRYGPLFKFKWIKEAQTSLCIYNFLIAPSRIAFGWKCFFLLLPFTWNLELLEGAIHFQSFH